MAARARAAALAAERAAAVVAAGRAVVAELAVASLADRPVVFAGQVAAVAASDAAPAVERHKGAARVVGREGLSDDRKKVEQPPGGQRRPNGAVPFAFAKLLIANVGVRHAGVDG